MSEAKFKQKSLLFESSKSQIWLCEDLEATTCFVLKIPTGDLANDTQRERYQKEYDFLCSLDHPNIIKAQQLFNHDAKPALILQYFEGIPLSEWINHSGPLAISLVYQLAIECVATLNAIHQAQIAHLDFNNQNILYHEKTGEIKVIDFDIACRFEELDDIEQMNGSLAYIAPEQTKRIKRGIDYRSDFYNLGISLWQMLAGKLPFQAEDTLGLIHAHLSSDAADLTTKRADLPKSLWQIIAKLIEKDPAERYQSCWGIYQDLQQSRSLFRSGDISGLLELGQHDFDAAIDMTQEYRPCKLHSKLLQKLRSNQQESQLHVITGSQGSGKSRMITQVLAEIFELPVSELLNRDKRQGIYHGLQQAFAPMLAYIQADANRLQDFQSRLTEELGDRVSLLKPILPGLDISMDDDRLASLSATESINRFHYSITILCRCFQLYCPMTILCLDELSSFDKTSIFCIDYLVRQRLIPGYRILLASRSNDLPWPDSEEFKTYEYGLENLSLSELHSWLTQLLHRQDETITSLAECCHEKTNGLMLAVVELIKSLLAERLIYFDWTNEQWGFDLDTITHFEPPIVDEQSILHRLNEADELSRSLVDICSLLHEPMNAHLAEACFKKLHPHASLATLIPLIYQQRLLLPDRHHRYRFGSASIKELIKQQIPAERSERVNELVLDELCQQSDPDPELLLSCLSRLRDSTNERYLRLSWQLHFERAGTHFDKAAYSEALHDIRIANQALEQLPTGTITVLQSWQSHLLALSLELIANSEHYPTQIERCQRLIREHQLGHTEELALHRTLFLYLQGIGEIDAAINHGRKALAILGHQIALKPNPLTILSAYVKSRRLLRRLGSVHFICSLKATTYEELSQAIEIMENLAALAYTAANEPLYAYLTLHMTNLILQHGRTKESPIVFCLYGVLIAVIMRNDHLGYDLAKAALLLQKQDPYPAIDARLNLVFGIFLQWRFEDIQLVHETFQRGYEEGLRSGDFFSAAFCFVNANIFQKHLRVQQIYQIFDRGLPSIRAYRPTFLAAVSYQNLHRLLLEPMAQAEFDFEQKTAEEQLIDIKSLKQPIPLIDFYRASMIYFFHSGQLEKAWQAFQNLDRHHKAALGMLTEIEALIYGCVIQASRLQNQYLKQGKRSLRHSLRRLSKRLNRCLQHADQFRSIQLGIRSILAYFNGHTQRALELGKEAWFTLETDSDPIDHILLFELTRIIYEQLSSPKSFQHLVTDVYLQEQRWGAEIACAKRRQEFPWLGKRTSRKSTTLKPRETTVGLRTQDLDLETVVKANRAISENIALDQLSIKLLSVICENAGAQRGSLFLVDNRTRKLSFANQFPPGDKQHGYHQPIIDRVQSTKQSIVIHNASTDSRYQNHEYIKQGHIKSIICSPLTAQSELIGILYLENNLHAQVFDEDRVNLLQMLSAQAVISIRNAMTYQQIENLVAEKTRDIRSLLHSIEQGIFTIESQLRIGSERSALLPQLTGRTADDFQTADDFLDSFHWNSQDEKATIREVLLLSIHQDLINFDSNRHLLPTRCHDPSGLKTFDLEWTPICSENSQIEKLLITIRDQTEYLQLLALTRQNEKELKVIGEILALSHSQFEGFLNQAQYYLEPKQDTQSLRRNLHSLKGLARIYNLSLIAEACHQAESQLQQGYLAAETQNANKLIPPIQQTIDYYQHTNESKLLSRNQSVLSNLALTQNEQGATLSVILHDLINSLPDLAKELGKPVPRLKIQDDHWLFKKDKAPILLEIFTHILRNSLDHGLEPAEERLRKGKTEQGIIGIKLSTSSDSPQELCLTIEDDGKGLHLATLLQKAASRYPEMSWQNAPNTELAQVIFLPELSTKEQITAISGRGVGLDAVKERLKACSADIHVELKQTPSDLQEDVPFCFVIRLASTTWLEQRLDLNLENAS